MMLSDLVDQAVCALAKPAVSARILAQAAPSRALCSTQALPDPYLEAVAQAIAAEANGTPADAYRLLGQHLVPLLEPVIGATLRRHSTAITFFLDVNQLLEVELLSLLPEMRMRVLDVEMLDLTTLRVSLLATDTGVAILQGLLIGLARHYGQESRFRATPERFVSVNASELGRRYLDVAFPEVTREIRRAAPMLGDPSGAKASAVAPRGGFR